MSVELHDTEKLLGLTRQALPKHIAIIMDGNGRWALNRGLPRIEGHRQGAKTVKKIVYECVSLGIEYLTLYSFSMENWKRPREEVEFLMHLCVEYLSQELPEMMDKNVRLKHLGRKDRLPEYVQDSLDKTMAETANNTGMTLSLALNYSARAEISDAVVDLVRQAEKGEISANDITEELISEHLYTAGMPDPDLLIRTAGERRVSNFLLWQLSYAEFYVDEVCWPEFEIENLHNAIRDFARRERKFGGLIKEKSGTRL